MTPATRFTDPAAVEAWDTWVRWRDDQGLRDRTIDSTWARVAEAIASVEGPQARQWAQRWMDAFGRWQLLVDERLLREAGTGPAACNGEPLHAQLNLAAFATAGTLSARPLLKLDQLADTAALAMRLLDDAWLAMPPCPPLQPRVSIGVIGMADALGCLDIPYDSMHACQLARDVAAALANGALRGAVELACERGTTQVDPIDRTALWHDRHTPPELVDDARRWGVRYALLTAIEPHPRLAVLANNASDALDPMPEAGGSSPGRPLPRDGAAPAPHALAAQVRLRGAMQPWIDAPIDYPMLAIAEPAPGEMATLGVLAGCYGLPPPRFRRAAFAAPGHR